MSNFRSNHYVQVQVQVEPKKNFPKILELIPLRCVPSFNSLAQVLADICKCPISGQTIKYIKLQVQVKPKKHFLKNTSMGPPNVCLVSSASLI